MISIPPNLIEAEIRRRGNQKEKIRCEDKVYWLENYVFTLDPHDKIQPVKPFPKKEYLRMLVEIWDREKLLLIPKSRQMLMTWLCCALCLHEAEFNKGRYVFVQSKKEEDANSLVERIKFIYNQQPDFLKGNAEETYCKLKFRDSNSQVVGIPQGGDQIRMHTASRIFSDEMAFQPEAEDAYTAARPCIEGGGTFVGVSSANPGFFQELVEEEAPEAELRKGLTVKYTPSGFCVAKLHYTADPDKATPEWKTSAKSGFKHEDKWRKEYEIDFSALGGTLVYPELQTMGHEIFVAPSEIKPYWYICAGIDPGVRNPTSAHLYAFDEFGNVCAYWELYEKDLHYKDLARVLKDHPDFERFKRNIYIDPITATRVHHTATGIKSFKELLEQEGIYTNPGQRDRTVGAEKIREYITDRKLQVFKTCPKMMWELENLMYEEWLGETAYSKNKKEDIVPRNDHAWSELRYVLMSNPPKARKPLEGMEAKIKQMIKDRERAGVDQYSIGDRPSSFSPDEVVIKAPKRRGEEEASNFYRV